MFVFCLTTASGTTVLLDYVANTIWNIDIPPMTNKSLKVCLIVHSYFQLACSFHTNSFLCQQKSLLLDSTVCCQCGPAESRHYHCCRRRRCDFVATCVVICSGGLPVPVPPPLIAWASAASAQPRHCRRGRRRWRELPPASNGVRAGPATP